MARKGENTKPSAPEQAKKQNTNVTEKESQQELIDSVSSESFDKWYREREYAENIREGTPYFNGPSSAKPPERHSPSSLLQCHRKITYKQSNAPAETRDPTGIFWIGSRFEEDIAVPFLRDSITGSNKYVTNSLWVDFTVQTEAGEIQIKGETDPVIVDQEGKPLILTEIKTKQSVKGLTSPNNHHRAQAHAYMKGLSEKYDRNITDAIILYGGRTNLDIKSFCIEFDPVFWRQTVVSWAETHTSYRLNSKLPPADPEYNWECKFCSYRERCGQGNEEYADIRGGLLPGYADYPRQNVIEYLEGHDDEILTPTLACVYPQLAERYEVGDWQCDKCNSTFGWQDIASDSFSRPQCPVCDLSTEPEQSADSPLEDQCDNATTQAQEELL